MFVVHKHEDVTRLTSSRSNFGSIAQFFRPPTSDLDDVKNYFGEEMAFFFHWFRFYTIQLAFPALLGFILFFRRYSFDLDTQRLLQDCYALFMALWAAKFCEQYSRLSIQQATLWGTRNYDAVLQLFRICYH